MVKIRLHGTSEEINKILIWLELQPEIKILSQSGNYKDRGKSEYQRVYLDVEFKAIEFEYEDIVQSTEIALRRP